MLIRRVLYFTAGILIAAGTLWGLTQHGYNTANSSLPLSQFHLEASSHFIHVDHDTVIQRNRFAQPMTAGRRQQFMLAEGGNIAVNVHYELIPQSRPTDFNFPFFPMENINEHFIGRLVIPSLGICHSLYFSGDDFYLRRDWRGRHSNGGELYIDGRSSGNLFRISNLINGHNMQSGTHFGPLQDIRNVPGPVEMFIKEYSTGRIFVYEAFAARIVHANDTGVHLNFSSAFVREQYYLLQIEHSFLPRPSDTSWIRDTPIITLNTCSNAFADAHLLVFMKMVSWIAT